MKTALGAVSADDKKFESLDNLGKKDKVIVISGSDAAAYMIENYPKVKLCECADSNEAIDALKSGRGAVWLSENTEAAEFAVQNNGYRLAIDELGESVEYAPAVSKGNKSLLKKINKIMNKLFKEDFFGADYRETLSNVYGRDFESALLIEKKDAETENETETQPASSVSGQ